LLKEEHYGLARKAFLLAAFVASLWMAVYAMGPFAIGATGSGYTGLDSYPYGTPSRPMVYRVMMPVVARAVLAVVPQAVEKAATQRLVEWRDRDETQGMIKKLFLRAPPLKDGQIFESAVVMVISFVALLMFLAMLYVLALTVFPESIAYALLAPVLAVELLPLLMVNNAYIYDFTELFFSCLLTYYMLKGRYRAYLFAFALATLNKETTLFMIVYFAAYMFGKVPVRTFQMLMLAQCVVYGAIKGGLILYFASYPGELIGPPVTVAGNLYYLWQWGDWKYVALCFAAMAYRWKDKPASLRAGMPMVAVHWLVYIVICVPGEYRDLYWSLPVMALMITHSIIKLLGLDDHPVFAPAK